MDSSKGIRAAILVAVGVAIEVAAQVVIDILTTVVPEGSGIIGLVVQLIVAGVLIRYIAWPIAADFGLVRPPPAPKGDD